MFQKILIANRGEIAVRIATACREMRISSVAVYSEADANALHTVMSDVAVCVGPSAPAHSYLAIDKLVAVGIENGAQAVHPGYGFLAENSAFARAVGDSGLAWIGPPSEAMELMGDKIAAKSCATRTGVPVLGGYMGDDQSLDRLRDEAILIGAPLMVKAAAGGGGRGMRSIFSLDALDDAIEGARREAIAAFGDGRLFLERLLLFPRHVEVQILADNYGNIVYLGERDCSAQRRHQKVLEESPSPVLTDVLRREIGEAAVRVAREVGYVGAGTVEFLFANDSFFFLEMNTRIQVEHPVTEAVTGLDLVQWQIKVAANEALDFTQSDITWRGHAIESRVYAEDPDRQFLPSTGTIAALDVPNGAGIRNDVGVRTGSSVTQFYDALLGKVIVHSATREDAILRMASALERYSVLGVTTNLAFLQWLVSTDEFRAGRVDVGFVDRTWTPPDQSALPREVVWLAAAFTVLMPRRQQSADMDEVADPWSSLPGWRHAGQVVSLRFQYCDETHSVNVRRIGHERVTFQWENDTIDAHVVVRADGLVSIRVSDRELFGHCERCGEQIVVSWHGKFYALETRQIQRDATNTASTQGIQDAALAAPMPATVVKIAVQNGDKVEAHQPLVVLEAMKTEHVIYAPRGGTAHVLFAVGDMVPAGAAVARIETQ